MARMCCILAHIQPSWTRMLFQSLSEWPEPFLTILPEAHQKSAGWTLPCTENPSEQSSVSWERTYAVLELEGKPPFDFGR
jgi:hypothetical protein